MSGAGNIKHDASTDDVIYEFKDCMSQFVLKQRELQTLFVRAAQQRKTGVMRVKFSNGLTVEVTVANLGGHT